MKPEDFVAAWQTSRSVAECALKLGATIKEVLACALALRLFGVGLKMLRDLPRKEAEPIRQTPPPLY